MSDLAFVRIWVQPSSCADNTLLQMMLIVALFYLTIMAKGLRATTLRVHILVTNAFH